MTDAKIPTGDIRADGFTPLDLEQFRRAFLVFLNVLSGQAKVSPPPATYLDTDTGRALPLEDTMFNRAWIAAGKLFEDEVLRLSFHRRLELFGSLAGEPRYERYIGFRRPSLHLTFVAALARFPFSKGMTEKACIAAFDEELQRQLGTTEEDHADKPEAATRNRAPRMAIDSALALSPSRRPPAPAGDKACCSLSLGFSDGWKVMALGKS